jgi:hypothetical protein
MRKFFSIVLAIGCFASMGTQAASVISLTIEDVGSGLPGAYSSALDGFSGAFRFSNINDANYRGLSLFTGDVASAPGPALGEIDTSQANGVNTFTSGFLFAGNQFLPETLGAIEADISLVNGVPQLTISSLPFVGFFTGTGTVFALQPQSEAPSDCEYSSTNTFEPLTSHWVNQIDATHFNYKIGWSHCITAAEDESGSFIGFHAHWRLEGIATIEPPAPVPVPAAVWLLGSGLLGLAGLARRKTQAK